jgi:EAL domain-containing protein (putative c-di-GMP-specific phosphodiesterase class I)
VLAEPTVAVKVLLVDDDEEDYLQDVPVSVNVSGRQLDDPGLPGHVRTAITDARSAANAARASSFPSRSRATAPKRC